jgi:glucose-1-phosphate adenylyltransferase
MPFGGVFRIIDFTLSNVFEFRTSSNLRSSRQYKQERLHSYVGMVGPSYVDEFRGDCGEQIVCLPPGVASDTEVRQTRVPESGLIETSRSEHVLIVSGDQIYHMDYGTSCCRHATSGADLTIAAVDYPVEHRGIMGVIQTDPSDRRHRIRREAQVAPAVSS